MFKVSFPAGTSTYYTSIAGRPASAYYTDEATLCEPPGVWWGAGAEALGLTGEVDADQAAAVFDRLLDPRGDGTTTLGRAPGRYRSAEHIEAEMLAGEPDASPERREIIRIEAGQKARTARTFIDATFSPASVLIPRGLDRRAARVARAFRWETDRDRRVALAAAWRPDSRR